MRRLGWSPHIWFWVALGGALGAFTRASLLLLWYDALWTIALAATLMANLLGSMILGFGVQYAQRHTDRWPPLQSFLPAYCAGLTTFSGLTADVFVWFTMNQWLWVIAWLMLSAVLSVGSLAFGWWWSERWFSHRQQNERL